MTKRTASNSLIILVAALTLGACASNTEIEKAQTMAQQAIDAASRATSAAEQASEKADRAMQAAQESQRCCDANSEKMERLLERGMSK